MTGHPLYVQLIEGFCRQCGLDDPERILQGGPIAVDQVVFSLVHSEEVDAGLVFIYADLGDIPHGLEATVHRALLEMNLRICNGRGPVLALSEDSGRAVRVDHRPIAKTTPEALLSLLQQIAAGAKAWRDDPAFEKLTAHLQRGGRADLWPTARTLGRKRRDET